MERAKLEGIRTELFCFGDDVAFTGAGHQREGIKTGKRGLAGGTLLNKCLGSLAKRGHTLNEMIDFATALTNKIATMSVSVTSCDVPGSGVTFELAPDEMELGLGIHGESGILRTKLLTSRTVVNLILENLLDPKKSPIAEELTNGDDKRVAVLINNLGGLSNFELNIVSKDAITEIRNRGLIIERILIGHYVTSFSMNGVSITIMAIDDISIQLLDDAASTTVFPRAQSVPFNEINEDPIYEIETKENNVEKVSKWIKLPGCSSMLFKSLIKVATESMIANEDRLNQLDRVGGDGDCGLTCKKGALAILNILKSDHAPTFLDLASICE